MYKGSLFLSTRLWGLVRVNGHHLAAVRSRMLKLMGLPLIQPGSSSCFVLKENSGPQEICLSLIHSMPAEYCYQNIVTPFLQRSLHCSPHPHFILATTRWGGSGTEAGPRSPSELLSGDLNSGLLSPAPAFPLVQHTGQIRACCYCLVV